ncbi:hypothetical protein Cni_G19401 [Canna indica]|uniref:Uncharacterized protein n=1 Tax=Canna indica TaxID=4628 RepID=A0AAQ3KN41_9LILI|nr:hypothetical protein Cni_G19401 [Canna indica]
MALSHLSYSQLRPPATAILRHKFCGSRNVPARDRIIDFGKHKGKMLGSLPSSYLQWVSKNLRARDFEEWARMADEVLQDPVYRDRLEWEAAERILTGDARRWGSSSASESPVADLIDVSKRFGWDNDDKEAWARIDFELLGTSKGRRIPRLRSPTAGREDSKGGIFRGDSKLGSGLEKKSLGLGAKSITSRNVDARSSSAGALTPVGGRKDVILGRNSVYSSDLRLKRGDKPIDSHGDSVSPGKGKMGASVMNFTSRELKKDSIFRAESEGLPDAIVVGGRDVGFLSKGHRLVIGGGEEVEEEKGMEAAGKRGNREERREKRRIKREQQLEMLRREVGLEAGGGSKVEGFVQGDQHKQVTDPFPGRSSLLEKISRQGVE